MNFVTQIWQPGRFIYSVWINAALTVTLPHNHMFTGINERFFWLEFSSWCLCSLVREGLAQRSALQRLINSHLYLYAVYLYLFPSFPPHLTSPLLPHLLNRFFSAGVFIHSWLKMQQHETSLLFFKALNAWAHVRIQNSVGVKFDFNPKHTVHL